MAGSNLKITEGDWNIAKKWAKKNKLELSETDLKLTLSCHVSIPRPKLFESSSIPQMFQDNQVNKRKLPQKVAHISTLQELKIKRKKIQKVRPRNVQTLRKIKGEKKTDKLKDKADNDNFRICETRIPIMERFFDGFVMNQHRGFLNFNDGECLSSHSNHKDYNMNYKIPKFEYATNMKKQSCEPMVNFGASASIYPTSQVEKKWAESSVTCFDEGIDTVVEESKDTYQKVVDKEESWDQYYSPISEEKGSVFKADEEVSKVTAEFNSVSTEIILNESAPVSTMIFDSTVELDIYKKVMDENKNEVKVTETSNKDVSWDSHCSPISDEEVSKVTEESKSNSVTEPISEEHVNVFSIEHIAKSSTDTDGSNWTLTKPLDQTKNDSDEHEDGMSDTISIMADTDWADEFSSNNYEPSTKTKMRNLYAQAKSQPLGTKKLERKPDSFDISKHEVEQKKMKDKETEDLKKPHYDSDESSSCIKSYRRMTVERPSEPKPHFGVEKPDKRGSIRDRLSLPPVSRMSIKVREPKQMPGLQTSEGKRASVLSKLEKTPLNAQTIFEGQCGSKLATNICLKKDCIYCPKTIKPVLLELWKFPVEEILEVLGEAVKRHFNYFVITTYTDLICMMSYEDALKIFGKVCRLNCFNDETTIKKILAILHSKNIPLEQITANILYLANCSSALVERIMVVVEKEYLKDGNYWQILKIYFNRIRNADSTKRKDMCPTPNQLSNILQDCIYHKKENSYLEEICEFFGFLKYDADCNLEFNENYRMRFVEMLKRRGLGHFLNIFNVQDRREVVDMEISEDKSPDESPIVQSVQPEVGHFPLQPHNPIPHQPQVAPIVQKDLRLHKQSEHAIPWTLTPISSFCGHVPPTEIRLQSENFQNLYQDLKSLRECLIMRDFKMVFDIIFKCEKESSCSYNKCWQLIYSFAHEHSLLNCDESTVPTSALPFWTFITHLKNFNECLRKKLYVPALEVFKMYLEKSSKEQQSFFLTVVFTILRKDVLCCEDYFEMINIAVSLGLNEPVRKTLIDLAMYLITDFTVCQQWHSAHYLLQNLKPREEDYSALYVMIKAQVLIANELPREALDLFKRCNLIFLNREKWQLPSNKLDENLRAEIMDVLMLSLCTPEFADHGLFLFEIVLTDQQNTFRPIGLRYHVDMLMMSLIEKNDADAVLKLIGFIFEHGFSLKSSTFRLLVIFLCRFDENLAVPVFRYASNLGVYSTLSQKPLELRSIKQVVKCDMAEEELYLLFFEMTRCLYLYIGQALDKMGPNQLHVFLIMEDVPSKRKVQDDVFRDVEGMIEKMQRFKLTITKVLARKFYPPIELTGRSAERVIKVKSKSLLRHLKHSSFAHKHANFL